jgi:hypothetical protein
MGTARADVHSRDIQAHRPARNTVEKYLRAGDDEPRYAKRVSPSKVDSFADKLSTCVAIKGMRPAIPS